MIELGIREFRERLSEVLNGKDFVIVTNNGKEVGTYFPTAWKPDLARAGRAAHAVAALQEAARARGADLDGEMAALHMSPSGEPLNDA